MSVTFDPFRLLLISLAGWVNQHQRDLIDYLGEKTACCASNLGTADAPK